MPPNPIKNIFIDSNIYLSFYSFTNEDLEELRKFKVIVEHAEAKLFLTSQLIDEYWRNRENKISKATTDFNKEKLPNQFPAMLKNYPEYKILRELESSYNRAKKKLSEQLNEDIENNNLEADKLIKDLFKIGKKIEVTDELMSKAKDRFDKGNPPGKNESYGDAINWEALLLEIPEREDLFLIADDKDFKSLLKENQLKEFLIKDWRKKKHSEIYYYPNLSSFFKEHYPQIKIAKDYKKQKLISSLSENLSFRSAKYILRSIYGMRSELTDDEIIKVLLGCISNNQVYWIADEVITYINGIIEDKEQLLTGDLKSEFEEKFRNNDLEKNFQRFR